MVLMLPRLITIVLLAFLAQSSFVRAETQTVLIKNIAQIDGLRPNKLVGYGLVVGLDGSGDQANQAPFTKQAMSNLLKEMGINVPSNANIQTKNVASVIVTAELPAGARAGRLIDVSVSAMGNAKSLKGGTLVPTALKGVDGQVYALAQGELLLGFSGTDGKVSKSVLPQQNGARIPGGAIVERDAPAMDSTNVLAIEFFSTDLGQMNSIVEEVNKWLLSQPKYATLKAVLVNPRRLEITVFENEWLNLASEILEVSVPLPPSRARIIINQKTGSVAMNQSIVLRPAIIAHGTLSIDIAEQNGSVSSKTVISLPEKPTLSDLIQALNQLKVSPQDLMSILQTLQTTGSLIAEIEVQ